MKIDRGKNIQNPPTKLLNNNFLLKKMGIKFILLGINPTQNPNFLDIIFN